MELPTVEQSLEAADTCSSRPADKKALGPMFGRHLEVLAVEVRRLRTDLMEMDRAYCQGVLAGKSLILLESVEKFKRETFPLAADMESVYYF